MAKNKNQPPRDMPRGGPVIKKAETLAHDPKRGEVDPRTYFHLGNVHVTCEKRGDHQRILALNRLNWFVNKLCEEYGEQHVRVHFTQAPGIDATKLVEVRIQPLTRATVADEQALGEKVKARWADIIAKGQEDGISRWSEAT